MSNYVNMTVTQLNDCMKGLVDCYMPEKICVIGEISNFTNHYKTGHFYFTLKDDSSLLKAVMFKTYASSVKFTPKNSMQVLAYGRVSVFTRDGVYQLYVEKLEEFGIGELYAAYEQTKNKLSALGLFDEVHKKPLPRFPKRIGIITSPEAAAVADMKNILTRRYPLCEIHIYPALVQGKDAPGELCDGIVYFDNDKDCDLIIIGRGGGSFEDLYAFNDETLALTIFNCSTPVISAVGHETDYTICDFVADLRAPTPSAAAELAVPDISELKNSLYMKKSYLTSTISSIYSAKSGLFGILSSKKSLKNPMFYFESKSEQLARADRTISDSFERIYQNKASCLSAYATRLAALNPLSVLARGYGAVFDGNGNVITSAKSLDVGKEFTLELSDGTINANVTNISIKEDKK